MESYLLRINYLISQFQRVCEKSADEAWPTVSAYFLGRSHPVALPDVQLATETRPGLFTDILKSSFNRIVLKPSKSWNFSSVMYTY